jgi:hypothetical protein
MTYVRMVLEFEKKRFSLKMAYTFRRRKIKKFNFITEK